MKNKFLFSLLALSSLLLYSCEEFIETDLSKKSIVIIAPADNITSSTFTPTFWWNDVKGANKYQLQIVKPDFATIQQFIVDTTVTTDRFIYTLSPGRYQWRVRALNGSSSTEYVTYSLTIDSTLDLSGQTMILATPSDNYYSNSFSHTFTWNVMPNASNYVFQVYTSTGTPVGAAQSVTTNSTPYTFAAAGNYKWRIFAQNNTSNSPYKERNIIIDTTDPAIPVLIHPLANDTASNPVLLNWTSDASGSYDSVVVYADSSLVSVVDIEVTGTGSHSFTGTVGQDYYWRVITKDAAGNWSPYTLKRKFVIVP
ncbi:MAG TPA: hypothetical protein VF868_01435 [Bacteroidia bacterium]|jgi:hypothetical protein